MENIYGIIKQDGEDGASYFLEVAGDAYDTRAGHDHRRSLVPRPVTRAQAKAVLDAAQAANVPAEGSREPGVYRVSFRKPVRLAPAAPLTVEGSREPARYEAERVQALAA